MIIIITESTNLSPLYRWIYIYIYIYQYTMDKNVSIYTHIETHMVYIRYTKPEITRMD